VQLGCGGLEIAGGPLGFCGCDTTLEDRQVECALLQSQAVTLANRFQPDSLPTLAAPEGRSQS